MDNNTEKALTKLEKNTIFYKLKLFLKSIFKRKDNKTERTKNNTTPESNLKQNQEFWSSVKNTEDDETRLLKLQEKYRKGEIKEEDLTEEQIIELCELYDRQIEALQKSNEHRKEKILLYRQKVRNMRKAIK